MNEGSAKTKLSETLGIMRQSRSLTQKSVAEAAGTSAAYVSQIYSGKKTAGPKTVDTLADVMNASDQERSQMHRAAAADAGFKIELPDDF